MKCQDARSAIAQTASAAVTGHEGIRVGIDVASVQDVRASVLMHGERFLVRIFGPEELAYAQSSPSAMFERLAARFAAKEAAIKAFDLAECGVRWSDLAVTRTASGAPRFTFGPSVPTWVADLPHEQIALSLTHHGDCAAAVVVVLPPQS